MYLPHRKIDHGIDLNQELWTPEKKEICGQYVQDFNPFVNELWVKPDFLNYI